MSNENDNISKFDDLFKQGLENHSVKAPAGVFEAVSGATVAGATGAKLIVAKWVIGGLAAIGLVTGAYYLVDNIDSNKKSEVVDNSATKQDYSTDKDILLETNEVRISEKEELLNVEESLTIPNTDTKQTIAKVDNKMEEVLSEKLEDPNAMLERKKNYVEEGKYPIDQPLVKPTSSNHYIHFNGSVCYGSTFQLVLNTNSKATWYVNGAQVSNESRSIEYQFLKKMPFKVAAYVDGQLAADTFIDLSKPKVQIDKHDMGLDVIELIANASGINSAEWMYNDKIVSMDRKFVFDSRLYQSMPYLRTTDKNGCMDTFRASIDKVVPHFKIVQNVITPDGDGKNDDYEVDIVGYTSFRMIITDKSGKTVYSTNDPEKHWDGTSQITKLACPNGLYTVFVAYKLTNNINEQKEYDKVLLTK